MKVLITTLPKSFEGWEVYSNLEKFLTTFSNKLPTSLTLVFHNSHELDEEITTQLALLKSVDSLTIKYVNSGAEEHPSIKIAISALKGSTIEDEFFLDSAKTLNYLVDSSQELTLTSKVEGNINIINGFIQDLSNPELLTKYRCELVRKAVTDISQELVVRDAQLAEQAEVALDIIHNFNENSQLASATIDTLRNQLKAITEQTRTIPQSPSSGGSVLFFPPYSPSPDYRKPLFRVKKLGSMKFLVSFLMGFQDYLRDRRNLRPRFIIVLPDDVINNLRYQSIPEVGTNTPSSDPNWHAPIVRTSSPTSSVLQTLLEDDSYTAVLILDCIQTNHRHIINYRKDGVMYAIEGETILNTNSNLSPTRTFTSVIGSSRCLFSVGVFPKYPTDEKSRRIMYQTLSQNYQALYSAMTGSNNG